MSGESVLEVSGLTKSYGDRQAVRGVSFTLERSEVLGLLGPNGAGKSTTVDMIAGIVAPTSGTIQAKGVMGLVPQNIALYPSLTARENLHFFGRLHGLTASACGSRATELLELSGLRGRADDAVGLFSGGMKRRLNLVCGVMHEPKVLLLDEPTVGVDPQSRERIYEGLKVLGEQGLALLLTTHDMEEAERLCDRLAVMDEGRFIAEGSASELIGESGLEHVIEIALASAPGEDLRRLLDGWGALSFAPKSYRINGPSAEGVLPEIFAQVAAERNDLRGLRVERPNLGDVFLKLTGKTLRD